MGLALFSVAAKSRDGGAQGNGRVDPGAFVNEDHLLSLLERYYLLQEAGETPDLDALCEGDRELARCVRQLVNEESAVAETARAYRQGDDGLKERSTSPRRLGGYRLLHEIGHGGMASVFLAQEETLGRAVAVKVLHPSVAAEPATRVRFRREAEITAALDHPNIVPILTVGEDDGTLFIVMKLLEGKSLDAVEGPLLPHQVARIGVQLAAALHEAHVSGVLHRDVKPSNVFLEGDTPVLLDFGLAFELGATHLTRSGIAPGTLPYMSPEQLDGRSTALDPRTDVYSLAATLYEAACGTAPFRNERHGRLIHDILNRDPPPMRLPPRDRDLETILRRGMEKDRERRFTTCAEFAADLDRFLKTQPILSRRSGFTTHVVKLARRHRTATALGAMSLALILGLLAFASIQRYAFSHVFRNDIARVETLLDADADTIRARELIQSLLQRDPDSLDARSLHARCLATEAIDQFFDVIQAIDDRRGVYDAADIRKAHHELRRLGGDQLYRPFADNCIALASHDLGDDPRAEETLLRAQAEFGSRPSTDAALALVRGHDPVAAATAATPLPDGLPRIDADERVLLALIYRLAGVDVEERRALILGALEVRGDHYRARQALAHLELRSGNHERALGLFMGITTPYGYRLTTRLHIAYTALLAGHVRIAEGALLEVPPDVQNSRHAVMQAQVLRRELRRDELIPFVVGALVRWPDDPDLTAELGYAHLADGNTSDAREVLKKTLALGPQKLTRDRCQAALYSLDVRATHQRIGAGEIADPRPELKRQQERATELVAEVTDTLTAADVLLLRSRVEMMLGESGAAWATLQASLERDPKNPAARMAHATWVAEQAVNHRLHETPFDLPGQSARHVLIAEGYVAETLDGDVSGSRPIPPQNLQDAEYARFLLAFARGDHATVQDAYDRLPGKAAYHWAQARPTIDQLRTISEQESLE